MTRAQLGYRLAAVTVQSDRFLAFDRLRGLIMVLMAIDHASFFIARVHVFESWATPPPFYHPHAGASAVVSFLTRWITHLCAPGFFMLMGAGMVWLAAARRKEGWSPARIRRFFITRGLVLLVIQHLVENPAWVLGIVSVGPSLSAPLPTPGGGVDFVLLFGVISALAVAMIFWAFLIEAPAVVVLTLSAAALAASVGMTPPVADFGRLFPIATLLTFVPSHANLVNVMYPWVPWLAPAGFGIVLARAVARRPAATPAVAGSVGAALLVGFVAMRAAALPFAEPHAALPGLIGLMSLTKYPPSPAFLAVTLGGDLLLLALFSATASHPVLKPLEVFGRAPLFFYLLHLWVFGLVSFAFPNGTSFAVMYGVWAAALVAMYPACAWYARFKGGKPAGSLWRLF
jgi:uncharacterized membrane protein